VRPQILSLLWALIAGWGLSFASPAYGDDLPEYRLKAAFIYNFMVYAEFPAGTPSTLNLCIHGADPFGTEIDGLQDKVAAGRTIAVLRKVAGESLKDCQVVFIAAPTNGSLPRVLESLSGLPILTVADSPGAMRRGVALNMTVAQGKITFEANLQAARKAGINLSSKLLRLATEVQQ
jgi:hypothetical protein